MEKKDMKVSAIQKCIYCNSTDLNISHIIPHCLLKKDYSGKITCKKHNESVGSAYEKRFAEAAKTLRNLFEIKTRKNQDISYKVKLSIRGKDYLVNDFTSTADLLWNKPILTDTNGESIKLSVTKDNNIVEDAKIEYLQISELIEMLFSETAKKLAAKVCYEFYCKENKVDGFDSKFDEIVKYIQQEEAPNRGIVTIIFDKGIEDAFNSSLEIGSNTLYHFVEQDSFIYACFRLWGLVTYKVKIYKSPIIIASGYIDFQNFISFRYDGVEEPNPISKLSIMSKIAGNLSEIEYKDIVRKRIKRLFETRILSINYLKTLARRIKKVIDSGRSEDEIVAYFLIQDYSINCFCFIVISVFNNKESYNYANTFNKNLKDMFSLENDLIMLKYDKFYDFLNQIGERNFIAKLSESMLFLDEIGKNETIIKK